MSKDKDILLYAAILGATGVTLGAFGAHWLQGAVQGWGLSAEQQQRELEIWDVGVRYQMYHALALLGTGLLVRARPQRSLSVAAALFVAGVLVFSGCLYLRVLTGVGLWGAVVPLGGTCLIAGWVALGVAAVLRERAG